MIHEIDEDLLHYFLNPFPSGLYLPVHKTTRTNLWKVACFFDRKMSKINDVRKVVLMAAPDLVVGFSDGYAMLEQIMRGTDAVNFLMTKRRDKGVHQNFWVNRDKETIEKELVRLALKKWVPINCPMMCMIESRPMSQYLN